METNINWNGKYLKYKKKYLDALSGGKLNFLPCNTAYNTKCKRDPCHDKSIYLARDDNKPICKRSTIFDTNQYESVKSFVDHILPRVKINGAYLQNVAENMHVMSAGEFGVTIYIGSLIIKIIHMVANIQYNAREVGILQHIAASHDYNGYKNNISKYFGFVTSNINFGEQLKPYKIYQNNNILSSLPQTSGEVTLNLDEIASEIISTNDNLLFLFMEKARGNLTEYFANKLNEKKTGIFVEHITHGLIYLHKLNILHNDIKPDNIVYTFKYFQLIDFGLSRAVKHLSKVPTNNVGTPVFFKKTIFEKTRSFYYDWYCLYLSILWCLKEILIIDDQFQFTDPKMDLYEVHRFGLQDFEQDILFEYLFKLCNTHLIPKEDFVNPMIMFSNAINLHTHTPTQIKLYNFATKKKFVVDVTDTISYETILENIYKIQGTPDIQPSVKQSIQPSVRPSPRPIIRPSIQPSDRPSIQPSTRPIIRPSIQPSPRPIIHPSDRPSIQPSVKQSDRPSIQPSIQPSVKQSDQSSDQSSDQPSVQPSVQPIIKPKVDPKKIIFIKLNSQFEKLLAKQKNINEDLTSIMNNLARLETL